MDLHDELPPAVPAKELLALADSHHVRVARPLGMREVAGHLVKSYTLGVPGRTVTEPAAREAPRPGRVGPAPCVWEAAWGADTVEGDVR
ncbi:hypothetical protein ACIRPU_42715 [Streptomyces sp. NPDC102259]|uniref:hypothetical protein n=1 Tax=Streptomyces sp. NPDC102259 TaxID=3366148 RepID=UPI003813946F